MNIIPESYIIIIIHSLVLIKSKTSQAVITERDANFPSATSRVFSEAG